MENKKTHFFIINRGVAMVLLLAACMNSFGQANKKLTSIPKTGSGILKAEQAETLYDLPAALSNIGNIDPNETAVCNFLTRHKEINGGAYLLASSDKPVVYKYNSTDLPIKCLWTVPGTSPSQYDEATISVQYKVSGIYDMPTLSITNDSGERSYTAPHKIKVGGLSEVTTIDMQSWGATYLLGAMPFSEGPDVAGYIGGTNAKGIVGFGNLFMFGTDDAYMDGVNVYLHHKPTKYKADAKITLQVWYPSANTDGSLKFRHIPVEASVINMSDIKADGEEGAWALTADGAVASFMFDAPLDLNGKPLLFISVEGFSNDPQTEDFAILADLMGKELDEISVTNRLAHNSFARLATEDDYLRPIHTFGGGYGSLAICPLIRTAETTGIGKIGKGTSAAFSVRLDDGRIQIKTDMEGRFVLMSSSGKTILAKHLNKGYHTIPANGLPNGIYIVRGPNNTTVKVLKQHPF